ncbi:DsbE family thiol:disulfide interchange protein [Carnimonas nigrificans]|uniref:DsbE family thiol:disulfide interchange protein n=1 Tax=Carnimonas nigrificans TaxID=64323 RepID=UPI000471E1DF|nr:DsbE family thiol:disulfide interchange protein [Carnimonas nigrificans]
MKAKPILFIPLVIFVGLAVLLWHGLGNNPTDRESALLSTPFPDFTLATVDDENKQVTPEVLKGQVTLVNVWGAWCPTCKQEMPQLLDLAQRGVRIVGVDYKDQRSEADKFMSDFGNPFALNIFDPDGSLGFDLGVYGAPESFIVDANGVIRYHHTGYITAEDVDNTIMPTLKRLQQ